MGFVVPSLPRNQVTCDSGLFPDFRQRVRAPRQGPDHGSGVGVSVGGWSFCWIMSRMNA